MAKQKRKKVIVEVKSEAGGRLGARAVTYQRELVHCGRSDCPAGKLHGPYWYAYWRSAQRSLVGASKLCKVYIGKDFRRVRIDEARKAEAPKRRKAA